MSLKWTNLTRVTKSTDTLLTLDEVKAQLRIDATDEDDFLTDLVQEATDYISGPRGIGVNLLSETWRGSLNHLPSWITIPLGPVTAISSITYRDLSGDIQTLDPSLYIYDLDASPCVITPAYQVIFPSVMPTVGAVKITFVTGYASPDDVPADLKRAAKFLISHWYTNREPVVGTERTATPTDLTNALEAIFTKHRVVSFG